MTSHRFDTFARSLATNLSRRQFVRVLAGITAGMALHEFVPALPRSSARGRLQEGSGEPAPPAFWPPDFPLEPPGQAIDDYVDCIAAGHTPEACDKGVPWCEIREYLLDRAFPNITGLLEVVTPFGEDCGTTDCLQCCYVPQNNGCHSSYIGEGVINCRADIYGEGTRGVGLTLLLAEPPPEGTCLFTPQVCSHIALCVPEATAASARAAPANYLADPRAIRQRARVFADYALTQSRHYLDEYATDTPDSSPLQALNDAILGRGWATWRQDMAALSFDLNDPLFRVVDTAGNLIEPASRANVSRILAWLRLLTGLPNSFARLEQVESRVWSPTDKDAYLVATPDPDATLAQSFDVHIMAILARIPSLQDYRLLAVPLAGEAGADGVYGGMTLGRPPVLRLLAASSGLDVTLTATLDDPIGSSGLERPLAIDWGDGSLTRDAFPVGRDTLTFSHTYAAAGRFAIYGVTANDSGLRGAACCVVQIAGVAARHARATATLPVVVRAGLSDLSVLNVPFTYDIRLALYFADAAGLRFRAGRSRIGTGPTNISMPVELGAAYAHNPARLDVSLLSLEPRHGIAAPAGGRIPMLKLSQLTLGVFSTARMQPVDASVSLTIDMLNVFVASSPTPLPASELTLNGDGTISVPLLYRAASSAPWHKVERIDIAFNPTMFEGFVLNAEPVRFEAGTSVVWIETRPGTFERVPDEPPPATPGPQQLQQVFLPMVQREGLPGEQPDS